eukprot:GHRQ01020821.1.p3 GENE.GHRQ01020821.1~~GHRQ01020821.1.p3  ORF type:complete len:110 (+),score=33.77 GHRQ01020821.1:261-590(+)
MEYRRLGTTGLKVSALSYGAWVTFGTQVPLQQAKELLQAARDAGVNFFDNAEVYAKGQAEDIMGKAFKVRQQQAETTLHVEEPCAVQHCARGRQAAGVAYRHQHVAIKA